MDTGSRIRRAGRPRNFAPPAQYGAVACYLIMALMVLAGLILIRSCR